jgi:hypothetical protein
LPLNDSFSKGNVTFYYNVSDTFRPISNCSLIINGSINKTNTTVIQNVSQNFTVLNLNDAHYLWNINCTDDLGNENESKRRLIKIDNTGPTATLDRPQNFTNISTQSYMLNASVNDDSGIGVNVTSFYYRENPSASWNLICTDKTPPYNCIWDTSSLTEGTQYEVRVNANDSLDNTGLFDIHYNITIDRTPPVITLISPNNNSQDIDGDNILFEYNVTDSLLEISNCSLIINNTINQTNYSITKSITQNFSLSGLENGNYTWNVNCSDSAGNQNTSETRNIIIAPDTDPPIINLTSPTNGSVLSYNDVIFQYNVSDSLSGIANCSLIINGIVNQTNTTPVIENEINSFSVTDMADGLYIWNVSCTDTATTSNIGYSKTFELTIQEATSIIVNVTTDEDSYESIEINGELANISTVTKDQFGNILVTNVTTSIIKANTTIPWWNSGFKYRQLINLTNNYAKTLESNYTVNHSIDTKKLINESKLQDDGDDLRIAYWNNDTNSWIEIDRIIIGLNTTETSILFRTQKNISGNKSDMGYYVYYGNSTVSNPPNNWSKVYFYYDDFDNDTLSSYNTTKAFDFGGISEDDDSALSHDTATLTIRYTGQDNYGKSIRYDNLQIKDLEIEVQQNLESLPSGGSKADYELGARINGDNYYFLNIPNENAFWDGEIGRYNNGVRTVLQTKTLDDYPSGKYWNIKFIIYNINSSTVSLRAYINGTEVLAYNDSAANKINQSGGFGTGSIEFIGNWDNLTVKRYVPIQPTTTNGLEEEMVYFTSGQTDSNGIFSFNFNTTNQSYTNYSAVSLASNPPFYNNGVGYNTFEILPDTTSPIINLTRPRNNTGSNIENVTFFYIPTDNTFEFSNCSIVINNVLNKTNSSSVINAQENNFTINNMIEGKYNWSINCTDYAGNVNNSETWLLHVDFTPPIIKLNTPENNSVEFDRNVTFSFNVSDDSPIDNCSIIVDWIMIGNYTNITRDVSQNFTEFIGFDNHTYFVNCTDVAGNSNVSEVRYFNVSYMDLTLTSSDIVFSDTSPVEQKNITINATIYNLGTKNITQNFTVQFFETNPNLERTQINDNITVQGLSSQSNTTISVNWTTKIGTYIIEVVLDVANNVDELNETNNNATKNITIISYQIYYGNFTVDILLDVQNNSTLSLWPNGTNINGNIFAVDSDSNINWYNLTAISRNLSNNFTFNDFNEIDIALNMTNFIDSINSTWTYNNSPKNTTSFIVFNNQINFTPIVNSTNNSNFLTGILWDSSDSNNGEYNGTQDLIFITTTNLNKQGAYGIYDYEIKFPANLRRYRIPNNYDTITLYVELP